MRAPDAPIGWPIAIAPPLTLILAASQPISLFTDSACAANASLASIRSRSAISQPASSSARLLAATGPIPMIDGSTPALAPLLIVASTGAPRFPAPYRVHTTPTAAPQFRPLGLAGAT